MPPTTTITAKPHIRSPSDNHRSPSADSSSATSSSATSASDSTDAALDSDYTDDEDEVVLEHDNDAVRSTMQKISIVEVGDDHSHAQLHQQKPTQLQPKLEEDDEEALSEDDDEDELDEEEVVEEEDQVVVVEKEEEDDEEETEEEKEYELDDFQIIKTIGE